MHRFYISFMALWPYVLSHSTTFPQYNSSAPFCSQVSQHGFRWSIRDFDFHASYIFSTPAHQNSWGYVSFNLSNPSVPNTIATCSAASNQLEDFFHGTVSYDCTVNGTSGPAPATFSFNRPSGELDIKQSWVCDDKDPKYP